MNFLKKILNKISQAIRNDVWLQSLIGDLKDLWNKPPRDHFK